LEWLLEITAAVKQEVALAIVAAGLARDLVLPPILKLMQYSK
jgi:hypothetical protein